MTVGVPPYRLICADSESRIRKSRFSKLSEAFDYGYEWATGHPLTRHGRGRDFKVIDDAGNHIPRSRLDREQNRRHRAQH